MKQRLKTLMAVAAGSIAAVGPQVGYFFKFGNKQAYANLRGYWEFAAQNRVEGYAIFATVSLPLGE